MIIYPVLLNAIRTIFSTGLPPDRLVTGTAIWHFQSAAIQFPITENSTLVSLSLPLNTENISPKPFNHITLSIFRDAAELPGTILDTASWEVVHGFNKYVLDWEFDIPLEVSEGLYWVSVESNAEIEEECVSWLDSVDGFAVTAFKTDESNGWIKEAKPISGASSINIKGFLR